MPSAAPMAPSGARRLPATRRARVFPKMECVFHVAASQAQGPCTSPPFYRVKHRKGPLDPSSRILHPYRSFMPDIVFKEHASRLARFGFGWEEIEPPFLFDNCAALFLYDRSCFRWGEIWAREIGSFPFLREWEADKIETNIARILQRALELQFGTSERHRIPSSVFEWVECFLQEFVRKSLQQGRGQLRFANRHLHVLHCFRHAMPTPMATGIEVGWRMMWESHNINLLRQLMIESTAPEQQKAAVTAVLNNHLLAAKMRVIVQICDDLELQRTLRAFVDKLLEDKDERVAEIVRAQEAVAKQLQALLEPTTPVPPPSPDPDVVQSWADFEVAMELDPPHSPAFDDVKQSWADLDAATKLVDS